MRGSISSCVTAHIYRLDFNQLFTTQELLKYGNRAAVDQRLYHLARIGYIKRIGSGIYLKCDAKGRFREVATYEAVKLRAEADGMIVVAQQTKDGIVFLINGRTRTILINGEKIKLKQASMRKLSLGESKAASLLRSFWDEGKNQACTINTDPEKYGLFRSLSVSDKEELRLAAGRIPDWLNKAVNSVRFGHWLRNKN